MEIRRRKLTLSLEQKDIEELIKRFHLREEDGELLEALKKILEEIADCSISYSVTGQKGYGIVTLGSEIDRIQDSYSRSSRLYEALLIDYMASALLDKAYLSFNAAIREETGLIVKEYRFPGAELPIGEVAAICSQYGQDIVAYNSAYAMTPRQSVVFEMGLTDLENDSFCHVCSTCTSGNCSHRRQDKLHE